MSGHSSVLCHGMHQHAARSFHLLPLTTHISLPLVAPYPIPLPLMHSSLHRSGRSSGRSSVQCHGICQFGARSFPLLPLNTRISLPRVAPQPIPRPRTHSSLHRSGRSSVHSSVQIHDIHQHACFLLLLHTHSSLPHDDLINALCARKHVGGSMCQQPHGQHTIHGFDARL